MIEPTELDQVVADLCLARTSVAAERRRARAALTGVEDVERLAHLSHALTLVEGALAAVTDLLPDDLPDLDDDRLGGLVVDPSTASWSRLVLGRSA